MDRDPTTDGAMMMARAWLLRARVTGIAGLPVATALALLLLPFAAARAQVNLPPAAQPAQAPPSPKMRPAAVPTPSPAPAPAVAPTVARPVASPVAPGVAPAVAPVPQPGTGTATGQPVPRFVSLKSDRVNVRRGPGPEHGIDWVFRRAGLPIEIVAESEIWRRIRDSEGAMGWVLASLLSGRRTALVEPWEVKANASPPLVPLLADPREGSAEVARVEAGVIASVRTCDGRWCYVIVNDLRGYLEQRRLWGVYKGESVK